MKQLFRSTNFWHHLAVVLFAVGFTFLACDKTPPTTHTIGSRSKQTYTVDVGVGNQTIHVTGVENITVTLPTGEIVFPCKIDTITTPPVDTFAGRSFVFGVNTNHWQPKDKQTKFQSVREYLPIGWAFTAAGFYGQPLKQAQKQFLGIDDYLAHMKSANVDVLLCLMQSPDWLNGHSEGWNTNDWPPIRPGANRAAPSSYSEIAGIYGAFAKRYGSRVWPSGSYRIDPAPPRWNGDERQTFKSGLALVKQIEVGNEPDRWWKIGTPQSEQYMTPVEYAAMLVAVYDSIKAADPSMTVVMAGLTNYDVAYLTKMKAVFDGMNRKFPADVINVHHYSNAGNLVGVHPPTWWANMAVAPELDADMVTLSNVVAFAKSIGVPCWVTEFGYDTEPGSQMSPTPVTNITNENVVAQWNVRWALESVRLGAVRSYVFTMADEPNPKAGLYQSSGLLRGEAFGYAEKPAFGQFVAMADRLRGFKYVADESKPGIRVMKFVHDDGRNLFAYWSPTMTNATFGSTIAGNNVTATETVQFLNVQHSTQ